MAAEERKPEQEAGIPTLTEAVQAARSQLDAFLQAHQEVSSILPTLNAEANAFLTQLTEARLASADLELRFAQIQARYPDWSSDIQAQMDRLWVIIEHVRSALPPPRPEKPMQEQPLEQIEQAALPIDDDSRAAQILLRAGRLAHVARVYRTVAGMPSSQHGDAAPEEEEGALEGSIGDSQPDSPGTPPYEVPQFDEDKIASRITAQRPSITGLCIDVIHEGLKHEGISLLEALRNLRRQDVPFGYIISELQRAAVLIRWLHLDTFPAGKNQSNARKGYKAIGVADHPEQIERILKGWGIVPSTWSL